MRCGSGGGFTGAGGLSAWQNAAMAQLLLDARHTRGSAAVMKTYRTYGAEVEMRFRSWMQIEVALHLSRVHELESALPISEQAVYNAQRSGEPEEASHRKIHHATLLSKAGQGEQALELLAEAEEANPNVALIRMNALLVKIQWALSAGQESEADLYLSMAYRDLDTYHPEDIRLPVLRARLEALKLKF